ncbi:MAG: HU family DNA-binding protein [Mediterranea sp.]|jgi:DNA-binding protein HU-beta|nr:HU family DNA-binding protein [Mediterranea sp.]
MNKVELISAIAEKSGLSKINSRRALDAFMSSVATSLNNGDRVSLVGFGTFLVVEKKARTGINPATKKPIQIPARKAVKFKVGAELSKGIK